MVSHAAIGDGATASRLVDQIEEDAGRLEAKARQSFQEFCARERLMLADTPIAQGAPSAQWLRQIATKPTGLRSWDAQLTSSLSDVAQTIPGCQSTR